MQAMNRPTDIFKYIDRIFVLLLSVAKNLALIGANIANEVMYWYAFCIIYFRFPLELFSKNINCRVILRLGFVMI